MLFRSPLSKIPVFVTEGAVIAHYPVQQFVGEKQITALELKVYYSETYCETELYEDDGEGYGYKNKAFSVTAFGVSGNENECILSRFIDRLNYNSAPDWETYTGFDVYFYGVPFVVNSVLIDGQSDDFQLIGDVIRVKLKHKFNEINLMKNVE